MGTNSPGLVIHGVKNGYVCWRTDGGYVMASKADVSAWEIRLLDHEPIRIHGNTLDQSDVVELRVALDTDAKRRAGVAL